MRALPWLMITLIAALACRPPAASAQPTPVANVETIAGAGNLFYQDDGKPSWYRAFVAMESFLGQHLKTDADSVATVRFKLGGLININKASEMEIVGTRDAKLVGNTLLIKSGSLWARVSKQKEELRIKSAGGVMAIKGTEFVVQVQENGDTTLSLLEGTVAIEPVDGDPYLAEPGAEVSFGPKRRLVAQLRTVQELLTKLRADLGERFFNLRQNLEEVRNRLNETRDTLELTRDQMEDMRGDLTQAAEEARASGERAREDAEAARSAAEDARTNALNIRDQILGSLGRGGSAGRGGSTGRGGATAPAPARPAAAPALAGQVSFTTPGFPRFTYPNMGAAAYVIMVARGDSFRGNLAWAARTSDTRVDYPADARPLEAGSYRWRVCPLNASGKPAGRPLEGAFTCR